MDVVNAFLAARADFAVLSLYGMTVLQMAASNGNINIIVQSLLENDVNINDKEMDNEWTALHFATYHCHINMVQALLAVGEQTCMKKISTDGQPYTAQHIAMVMWS